MGKSEGKLFSRFRPLRVRESGEDESFLALQEGIPDHMMGSIVNWLSGVTQGYDSRFRIRGSYPDLVFVQHAENALGLSGLRRMQGADLREKLVTLVVTEPETGLDVLDFCLAHQSTENESKSLNSVLRHGGSAWEVGPSSQPDSNYELTRRVDQPVRPALDELPSGSRARQHLASAWRLLMGRNSDPSGSYRESVRAVEAAAKPVVLPRDSLATLGKVITALRDNPTRWEVDLDAATSENIKSMCEMIWKSQLDRHGTDDKDAPLSVGQAEADAAFYVAMSLVRMFTQGHIVDTRGTQV